ncbi:damage-control phosphatase ARMT1-like isoform X2 [Harmonia axyridis]|uniref:damage-control phosphatase ARMT1-like isoform X2 n=1 Tax=Harmonia axyridis TaxID=115357 RepID=UPI001E277928|nr:damage-control phosphatase ARMT1-like isoform X2 [Harmonia axyridis]
MSLVGMDIATPRNVQLSGFFRRSNAVMNAQERIPNCLIAIANELTARISDIRLQYGQEAAEELKIIINKIHSLREEVLQDVPFRKLLSNSPDAKFYNDYLEKMTSEDCRPTMLQTVRVYAECYVYRRVWECFELSDNLKKFDPYESTKDLLYQLAVPLITKTGQYLKNMYKYPSQEDKIDFEKLAKLLLWSNQGDYIMSKEFVLSCFPQILSTKKKEGFIVCNQVEQAWEIISDRNHSSNVIAIICDNVGFELFAELCMADYLYTNYYARTIHFHVKHIPWFISDVMEKDIYWMLHQLSKSNNKVIQDLSANWKEHFKTGRWKIITRKYWILPIGFSRMKELDPILYKMLEETKIIIVKGDLNYRKLLEDINCDPSAPFSEVLHEFYPNSMLLVRILKCDVVCNVPRQNVEKFDKLDKNWMDCGLYGLIQFAPKPKEMCDCMTS